MRYSWLLDTMVAARRNSLRPPSRLSLRLWARVGQGLIGLIHRETVRRSVTSHRLRVHCQGTVLW